MASCTISFRAATRNRFSLRVKSRLIQHICRKRHPLSATTINITLTGDGLHVEQMSLRACWHLDHYLPLLIPERECTVLGNLWIDLHMDSGPTSIKRTSCMLKRPAFHGQGDRSALGQRDILANGERLTRLHLSRKPWMGAGP